MKRWTAPTLAALVLLMLGAAAAVQWSGLSRGHFDLSCGRFYSDYAIRIAPKGIHLRRARFARPVTEVYLRPDLPWLRTHVTVVHVYGATHAESNFLGLRHYRERATQADGSFAAAVDDVLIPRWLTLTGSALMATLMLRALHRYSLRCHRSAKGLCPRCGYDLRATPARCPECGKAATESGAHA